MATTSRRLALKIDVDTLRGARDGVPGLLEELDRAGVKASFFVSVGPDNSGKAVFRVFRKKGFLGKMLRTNAARMYGWSTLFYGTLLPAPSIGRRAGSSLRLIQEAGHEVHLHAWDHVAWQDELERWPVEAVEAELRRGLAAFQEIFGRPPCAFAAPAWFCTDEAFLALEKMGFDYISVSRGAAPYRPVVRGRTLDLIEIPTTLPTLDETLGRRGITAANWNAHLIGHYRPGRTEVLTAHAETEGLAYRGLFRDLLSRHRDLGIEPCTLGDLAAESRGAENLSCLPAVWGEIPGRAGRVRLIPDPAS